MNDIRVGDLMKSRMGRDKGIFYVVMKIEGDFAWCANGVNRKADNMKRKRLKHLVKVADRTQYMADKLDNGEKVTNVELRRELEEVD